MFSRINQASAAAIVLNNINMGNPTAQCAQKKFLDDIPNIPFDYVNESAGDFVINSLKTMLDDSSLSQKLIDKPWEYGYSPYLYTQIINEFKKDRNAFLNKLDDNGFISFYERSSERIVITLGKHKISINTATTGI